MRFAVFKGLIGNNVYRFILQRAKKDNSYRFILQMTKKHLVLFRTLFPVNLLKRLSRLVLL